MDAFFENLANWLLVAIVIVILWAFAHKAIIGKYMMYEDYYNKRIQLRQQ